MTESVQIIYGSKRGTTRKMAELIQKTLVEAGVDTVVKGVYESKSGDLSVNKFNILGSSTWSDGDLQVDFIEFERAMDGLELKGTFCAVFGPGNSRFPFFCEAVEILQAKLISCGAKLLVSSLKTDELKGKIEEETIIWAEKLADAVKGLMK